MGWCSFLFLEGGGGQGEFEAVVVEDGECAVGELTKLKASGY